MAKRVEYNPTIIQQFAARLYSRADSVVAKYTLLGVFLGLLPGIFVGALAVDGSGYLLVVMAGVGGALGYAIGSERALTFRQQAQLLLCQVSIESNTLALLRLAQSRGEQDGAAMELSVSSDDVAAM